MAVEVTRFAGDFPQLAALMQRSWADNQEIPLLYSAEFLRSAFEYPGVETQLSLAVYSEQELLALIAGFPRRFQVDDRQMRLVLTSFLTASTAHKRFGYGLAVWAEIHKRARAAGYDGALSLCVEGDEMNRLIPSLARLFRLNTRCVFTVDYLARFLRPAKQGKDAASDPDIDMFLDLASALPAAVPFARLWTHEEAEWQCHHRSGAITLSASHNGRRGILTGYVAEVATTPPSRALLIEDILWGDLEADEQADLLQRFLLLAAARGAQSASCPVMRYASLEPFRAAGFRPSKRRVHIYLTTWREPDPQPVPAIYLDVL